MILRKVDSAVYNAVVIHLHKITIANLLIMGDKTLAVSTTDEQNMTTANLTTVWIFVYPHT
ncbi:MAG: hypothetical protein FWC86_02570 [Coriobacteriia bacterium]|nr:hypothetical protein [Coriobacteriia bacterium]